MWRACTRRPELVSSKVSISVVWLRKLQGSVCLSHQFDITPGGKLLNHQIFWFHPAISCWVWYPFLLEFISHKCFCCWVVNAQQLKYASFGPKQSGGTITRPQGFFPGGGPPHPAKILPIPSHPTLVPVFGPRLVPPQPRFVPENVKNLDTFLCQIWLLLSSKVP